MKKIILIFLAITILISSSVLAVSAAEVETLSDDVVVTDNSSKETTTTLPTYYNSAELGYTSSLKKQIGNICWAYSANAIFESFLLKNNLLSVDLDINHMDQWAIPRENGDGWQRTTLDAGYGYIPMGYFTSWSGPVDSDNNNINMGVTALRYYSKNDMVAIKEAIMRNGSVAGDYNTQSRYYNQANTNFCLADKINVVNGHSITVVGWDDNYSKDNFETIYRPLNDGAWLCKNSWGDYNDLIINDNDFSGYFWISYEDYYLFNEDVFTTCYSIESMQEITENVSLYQNEEFGATYEFNYISDEVITYFNVFDFSEKGNVIDKIIFESVSKGAKYSTYFVPTIDGKPVDDKTKWYPLDSGVVDYKGYICCDVEDLVVSQAKGAIAVEIDTTDINSGLNSSDENYVANGIGVCEWLINANSQEMIFTQQSEAGESFVTYNGEIMDVFDFYNNQLSDPVGGTLVIKTITNDTVDTTISGDVNFDEQLDINDATLIQRYLINIVTNLMEHQELNADFNKDGIIDVKDVTEIQKKLVKLA